MLRDRGAPYAWKKHIFEQRGPVGISKSATINVCILIEPTIYPVICPVQHEPNIVRLDMQRVRRDTMRSLRGASCPPERAPNENDQYSHNHAKQALGNEVEQQCDNAAENDGSEKEPCCDGHAYQAHHQKAEGKKESDKLRINLHYSP